MTVRVGFFLLLSCLPVFGQNPPVPAPAAKIVADRNAFTFTNYSLNISIEPTRSIFSGRGTVILKNDSDKPQKTAAMQISSSLKWAGIKIAGKQVEFASARIDSDIDHTGTVNEAVFELPEAVAPQGSIQVEVAYQGTISQDANRLLRLQMPEQVARASDWDGISEKFTALRGVGYVVWYPVEMEPALLSERNKVFELLARFKGRHAESRMILDMNILKPQGSEVQHLFSNGDSACSATGVNEKLTVSFLRLGLDAPTLVLGNFFFAQSTAGVFASRSKDDPRARTYATAALELQPEVKQWLRAPQSTIQVVENPEPNAVPFESGTLLLTPLKTDAKAIDFALVHTLAHAAVNSFRPWISEGIAHYVQLRLLESQGGRRAVLEYLVQHRDALALSEPEIENRETETSNSLVNTTNEITYRTKAMNVWWMLRDMIGDDPIMKALQAYKPEEDKEASYMQRLLENASHKNLDWFFSDWVYRDRGLPDFRVTAVYPRKNLQGGYLVTITVENLGNAAAEVAVRLQTKEGEIVTRLQVPAKEKASARVNSPLAPTGAIVNDGSVPESDLTNNSFTVEAPKQ